MIPIQLKAYYYLRPIIPRGLQLLLRRKLARYQRLINAENWPICSESSKPPNGWNGWPSGKKFSLILSHDVDTRVGYERVLQLSKLEEELGFRSTFNFVPERYGKISKDLIEDLYSRGFGIGVHGLKHDGKLYFSKRIFNRRVKKINQYLKEWGCRGFSSPSMHHRLSWLNALDIDYSISTFDVDPFEPQPDGAVTIFPITITGNHNGSGLVELPYTLPQDSTLYLILQEKSNDIWKEKIEWIKQHGGMALLNTHPDYMNFGQENLKYHYSHEHYRDFLEHIADRYGGEYWHTLASDFANFWKSRRQYGKG